MLAAGRPGEPRARAALSELCTAYWRPIYAYVRRRGHEREDARDLTQAFFALLLERNSVGAADPDLGRFRGWLLGALKHFLSNEWDRAHALKRGGGLAPISLDFHGADERLALEPGHGQTPESAFERKWALSVLERAFERLERQWSARGRGALFAALKPLLLGEEGQGYRLLGQRFDLSEGAIKIAAHRLRRGFRAALRAQIAETVPSEADLEAELEALIAALGRPAP